MFSKSETVPPFSEYKKMVSKRGKASFPSKLERVVASALLLLSSSTPREKSESYSPQSSQSSRISVSKSSGGSSSLQTGVIGELSGDQRLTVVAFVPPFHELQFKIVQKKRSKSICISEDQKMKSSKIEYTSAPAPSNCTSEITTADASLCLSSISSALSSGNVTDHKMRSQIISSQMCHRAEAILRFLSNGSASEVRIRQLLGDSPSTSKALRMLLKLQEVKRCGAGGRTDPYIYMIAQ